MGISLSTKICGWLSAAVLAAAIVVLLQGRVVVGAIGFFISGFAMGTAALSIIIESWAKKKGVLLPWEE